MCGHIQKESIFEERASKWGFSRLNCPLHINSQVK